MMPDLVRKWLRQQAKDFYAAGFDALVKRSDKYISVGGEHVEKEMYFSRFQYHTFYELYLFVAYLLFLMFHEGGSSILFQSIVSVLDNTYFVVGMWRRFAIGSLQALFV
jgi:hypothetical protein